MECQPSVPPPATIQATPVASTPPAATAAPLTFTTTYSVPYLSYTMAPAMGMSGAGMFGAGFAAGGMGLPFGSAMPGFPVGGGFAAAGLPGFPPGALGGLGQSFGAQQGGLSDAEIQLFRLLLVQSLSKTNSQAARGLSAFAATKDALATALADDNGGDVSQTVRLKAVNDRISQLSEKLADNHLELSKTARTLDGNITDTDQQLKKLADHMEKHLGDVDARIRKILEVLATNADLRKELITQKLIEK